MTPAAIEPVTWGTIVFMFVVLLLELSALMVVLFLGWKRFWNGMGTVKPVHVDGVLYVCIAAFVALQTWVSSDESFKYINPYIIFYAKGFCAIAGATAGALKMFRSTSYSDSLKKPVDNPPAEGQSPKV